MSLLFNFVLLRQCELFDNMVFGFMCGVYVIWCSDENTPKTHLHLYSCSELSGMTGSLTRYMG